MFRDYKVDRNDVREMHKRRFKDPKSVDKDRVKLPRQSTLEYIQEYQKKLDKLKGDKKSGNNS